MPRSPRTLNGPAGASRGLLLLALSLAPLSGCVGPYALRESRLRYNESYRKTNDEEILLNIVRLRYADSPVFIDLPNITSQFQLSTVGGGAFGYDGAGPGQTNLATPELFLKDAPTLSYTPRSGQQVGKRLMAPLTAELLRSISPGDNTELFLLAAVNGINHVPNAPLATSLNSTIPQTNDRYRSAVGLIKALQIRGALELRVATFDADTYETLPLSQIRGADMLKATQDGKVFRTNGDQALLLKREKSLVLVIKPEELQSPEVQELARIFGLDPGRSVYRIVSQENDEIELDQLPQPIGEDTLHLDMRSLLQLMCFISKGVQIPPEHYERGIVPPIPGPDGSVFDWSNLTRGFFRVCVSKKKPKVFDVAVPYRGYWYYIPENDAQSRALLSLLELILELSESESERAGPLLTLPVG
jgi:hypothetical protein